VKSATDTGRMRPGQKSVEAAIRLARLALVLHDFVQSSSAR